MLTIEGYSLASSLLDGDSHPGEQSQLADRPPHGRIMFDFLFQPWCPCDAPASAWVEERFVWLVAKYPRNILSEEDLWKQSDLFHEPLPAQLEQMANQFGLEHPLRVQWITHSEDTIPNLGNESRQTRILQLDEKWKSQPVRLSGALAHEVARLTLLNRHGLRWDSPDRDLLADLLAILLGWGVGISWSAPAEADGPLRFWPGTSVIFPWRMTAPMIGWVLSQVVGLRPGAPVPWESHLEPGTRLAYKQGLRFLRQNPDRLLTAAIHRS